MRRIQLLHGDCVDSMKSIPDKSVDLIVTDIPYGECSRKSSGLRKLEYGLADVVDFDLVAVLSELNRVCKGSFYVFCGQGQLSRVREIFLGFGLITRCGVWEKSNPSPMNGSRFWLSGVEMVVMAKNKNAYFNEHCKNTVFKHPTTPSKMHPTQKPVKLMERFILASSRENDAVLDCFMGSGTTGVACVNTNRRFIGIEKDARYFKIAQERIK